MSQYIMYALIDCIFRAHQISLYKLHLTYKYYNHKSFYIYFIVVTYSVLCLLLSIDKLYIHFGGSLEY